MNAKKMFRYSVNVSRPATHERGDSATLKQADGNLAVKAVRAVGASAGRCPLGQHGQAPGHAPTFTGLFAYLPSRLGFPHPFLIGQPCGQRLKANPQIDLQHRVILLVAGADPRGANPFGKV